MRKKVVIGIIVTSFSILLVCLSFYLKNNSSAKNKDSKLTVFKIQSSEKTFINGIIIPENSKYIYLDSTKGSVHKINVNNGQVVKKGDILFIYKNEQVIEQITQINTQINTNKNQKKNLLSKIGEVKKLNKVDSLATSIEAQTEAYEEQIASINIQINSLEEQLKTVKEKEYYSVISPIDGIVNINTDEKNLTSPFIIVESSNLYVSGIISEKEQPKLKANQIADVLVLSTNKSVKGKIISIGNRPVDTTANANNLKSGGTNISNYEVKIALDSQENLTNGFHVQATVKLSEQPMKIPKSAIIPEDYKYYVFKIVDNKLQKVEIKYENSDSNEVTVKEGLKEEDKIITNASKDMKEGDYVE
ncbi:efflux RND transporter periplasmic adaptor subunit [Caproiciproducens sp. MSJ-32]|uniref:efflux RND transporter periplasmic adaptor subunit n=1 Tax=Caproiciproducens sp. MSJ-32 TaxID=2841527 RepID=UPI001C101237|nr:efflux RND transporter periplasmic adaptor subunit [Caproiciproducens sp. MSJ-32]MBU5455237.1 efflux RND transporter periplasmic adaptor subunit [Caproiciproducens sp. MSJ-32]